MTSHENWAIWFLPPFSPLSVGGRSIVDEAVVRVLDDHHRGRYLLDRYANAGMPQPKNDGDDDRFTMVIFLAALAVCLACVILLSRWSQKASAARELASKNAVERKRHQHNMRCFGDAQCVMTVSEDASEDATTVEDPSQREVTGDGSRHAFVALPIPRPLFFFPSSVAPAKSNNIAQLPFLVSNCSAMCLEKNQVNDRVVRSPQHVVDSLGPIHDHPITSSSDGRFHVYHQSCILD